VDRDGVKDYLAFGCNNRSGTALVARLDILAMSAARAGHSGDIPWITEPHSLQQGVRWTLRFARDIYCPYERPICEILTTEPPDRLMVPIRGTGPSQVAVYTLALPDSGQPRLLDVEFNDAYLEHVRKNWGPGAVAGLPGEGRRLGRLAEHLTPSGWQPLWSPQGTVSETLPGRK
jgi:hypothetical protein